MNETATQHSRLAIITRTKDREVTLQRTAQSVAAQTCKDLVWILVNDGGARAHVERIADQVRAAGVPVEVVHHDRSKGRPAAANAGIAACACPLLVLLDDDDTQEPDFTEACFEHIDNAEFPCEGVAVWTDIIHERIDDERIVFIERKKGYHPNEISFLSLFYTNCFPPSAFVFSRRGWEAAGGFDERLHCSEDWFFNQNFIKFGRIGIVPKVLAYLHYRVQSDEFDSIYNNTMVAGLDDHVRYRSFWRDELIRNDIAEGRFGLGELNILALIHLRAEQTAKEIAVIRSELGVFRAVGRSVKVVKLWLLRAYRKMRDLARHSVRRLKLDVQTPRHEAAPNSTYQCAVCGTNVSRFLPLPDMYIRYTEAGKRFTCDDLEMLAVSTHHCPRCYSADRDRCAALFFRSELAQSTERVKEVLEFAPCRAFSAFLKSQPMLHHVTCDLFMEDVDIKGDITNLESIRDDAFDYLVCSHVLEHVEDDLAAMNEIRRILVPGGKAVIIVPIYRPLDECYENPTIIDPEERLKHFAQPDHVRLYSRNCLVSRLKKAGLEVSMFGIEQFGRNAFQRNGLTETSMLYIASKPMTS